MAYYYVSTTGTKSSGTSTPDDWSNANCYGSLQTAVNQGWTSADTIVLNDETHTISYVATAPSAALTGAQLNIASRSGDPALCIVQFTDGAGTSIRLNEATLTYTHSLTGITFERTVTHTVSGAVFIGLTGATSSTTAVNDCVFRSAQNNYAGIGLSGYFSIADSLNQGMTFENCEFYDLTSVHMGGCWFAYSGTGNTMSFIDCSFHDLSNTYTSAVDANGGIYGPGTISLSGCSIDTVSSEHVQTGEYSNNSFIYSTGTLSVTDTTFSNMAWTGASSGAFAMRSGGAFTLSNITVTDSYCLSDGTNNSIGGAFVSISDSASGTVDNLTVERCSAAFGTVLYASQGGSITATNIVGRNCTAYHDGIIYCGGWGDVSIDGLVLHDCTTGTSLRGLEGYGGALFSHLHTSATRSKTVTITNASVLRNTQGQGGPGGFYGRNNVSAYDHTVILTHCLFDNPDNDTEVYLTSQASCTLDVTFTDCMIRGGEAAFDTADNDGDGTVTAGAEVTDCTQYEFAQSTGLPRFRDMVAMTVTGAAGTGDITLSTAVSGFATLAAAYGADCTVDVRVSDGDSWEIARGCDYDHSAGTLSRGYFITSSTGSRLSLTSNAVVYVVQTAHAIRHASGEQIASLPVKANLYDTDYAVVYDSTYCQPMRIAVTELSSTPPKLDDLTAPDDNTDLDASTSAHGLLLKATAPASGYINIVGIGNGETAYSNKALFDATNPSALGTAATGTAVSAARRDHVHAMPSASDVHAGYALNLMASSTNPVDATTYYMGSLANYAWSTVADYQRIYIPVSGTIKKVYVNTASLTAAGSGEAWTMSISVNGGTPVDIATVSLAAFVRDFVNTGLSISVSAGDYVQIVTTTPNWATNPSAVRIGGYIWIEQ